MNKIRSRRLLCCCSWAQRGKGAEEWSDPGGAHAASGPDPYPATVEPDFRRHRPVSTSGYTYDGANRLTQVTSGTTTADLTYNGLDDLRTRAKRW